MLGALKNLRSQVSRAAGQAFAELYVHLGKAMELDLDKTVVLLLLKSADTNRFIRWAILQALNLLMIYGERLFKQLALMPAHHSLSQNSATNVVIYSCDS